MMKKLTILLMACLFTSIISAQTNGKLTVSVLTSPFGGEYAPKNVVAIWIEDNSGKFVKTVLAYANTRKTHLNTWEASTTAAGSAFNTTDATSGATQSGHGTRTAQWMGTDYSGKVMADGTYKVRMELTDENRTGNIASFNFTKGPNAQTLTPADGPSFSSISLKWAPSTTAIDPEATVSNTYVVYPNPGTGQFTVLGENIKGVKVTDLAGKLVYEGTTPVIDLTQQPKGVYMVTIQTEMESVVKKIIKE